MKTLLCATLLLVLPGSGAVKEEAVSRVWAAKWIEVPGTRPEGYGVFHFRRTFEIPSVPEHFRVFVSGDNRYQLYVNGARVAWGPARGDLGHWRYETVDIGPRLRAGKNVVAAVVWNDGPYRAVAQETNRTGFVLQPAEPGRGTPDIQTDRRWKCIEDRAYQPQLDRGRVDAYYALAANEKVDAREYPWGWEQLDFNDEAWQSAAELTHASPRDARDAPNRWMLVPSGIPLEEQKQERLARVREAEGGQPSEGFLAGGVPFTVPAHAHVRLLLDQGYLTTAYPELTVSGGRDATVKIRYAETLFEKGAGNKKWIKGNRNEVSGREFLGPYDLYIADGGARRVYRTLYWRTYRYVEVEIDAADEPLTVDDFLGEFTAYPFVRNAGLTVSGEPANREVDRILATGWRTARLCAHETYMDCPFYEQLQYAGDARIQMMISLYMTGDARLMKNGIELLNDSRTAEGATYSRAPSYLQQYIPPFSLWWIGMVHDYWMYVDDPEFVKQMLPGVRAVLWFYARYQKENGSLSHMPWWNFVDWVKQWPNGEPLADADGGSAAALDLQLVLAYQWAADLEQALGNKSLAEDWRSEAQKLSAAVLATDWDPGADLFADQPEHRTYSQQVNTLAVLAKVVSGERARAMVEKTVGATGTGAASVPLLAQSSIYFRAYTNATLREVGLGDRYLAMLGAWREMLADGLTTWAEQNGPETRSDCHAWGASPNFELLRTVAGIESMAPGFARVRIAPNLGGFEEISAHMPHPRGEIRVKFVAKGKLRADIELPEHVDGELDWQGSKYPLHAGSNHLQAGR